MNTASACHWLDKQPRFPTTLWNKSNLIGCDNHTPTPRGDTRLWLARDTRALMCQTKISTIDQLTDINQLTDGAEDPQETRYLALCLQHPVKTWCSIWPSVCFWKWTEQVGQSQYLTGRSAHSPGRRNSEVALPHVTSQRATELTVQGHLFFRKCRKCKLSFITFTTDWQITHGKVFYTENVNPNTFPELLKQRNCRADLCRDFGLSSCLCVCINYPDFLSALSTPRHEMTSIAERNDYRYDFREWAATPQDETKWFLCSSVQQESDCGW